MIAFFFALVFTANQGSAVEVKIADAPHVKSVQVVWQKKTVPAFHSGGSWDTFLGIDLDATAGKHPAAALITTEDGRVDRREITIDVKAKKYPTSRLNVDEKFVELNKP
ncbi:MAG TPA: hypothetical protein VJ853_12055, partial [Thermoanaerobaculia bacterium]|nr:hypothetical protein [Thermoanaerobaculia bacterium]